MPTKKTTKKKEMNQESDATENFLQIFRVIVILCITASIGYFVYINIVSDQPNHPFKLGLDLAGGSHLVYEADVTKINPEDVGDLMNVLRDVIERRVNIFGVSEPIVQVERSSVVSKERVERLVVELPGVTDVSVAVEEIAVASQVLGECGHCRQPTRPDLPRDAVRSGSGSDAQ